MIVNLMSQGEAESLASVAELRDLAELGGTRRQAELGGPLLELESVTVAGRHGEIGIEAPFTLNVRAGEVVGIAGVDGNGQRPLAEAIAGQRQVCRAATSGSTVESVRKLSIGARQRLRPALRHRRPPG